MVSDFIEEYNGYLHLTPEEFEVAKPNHLSLTRHQACSYLEYGKNKEGYWTSEKFMAQIEHAVMFAEIRYPQDKGYRLV